MPTTPATSDNSARMEKAPGDQSGATEIPQVAKDLWALYLEDANERSKAKAKLWEGNISSLLVFAGLFAGVVSSFVIDSRDSLPQSGPVPVTALAINFLWFLSLTFTLIGALAAVLAQTWLVKFSLAPAKGFKAAMERWIHDEKADKWHLHMVIACITVLIQLSLFLFLAGFALQATVDNHNLGWTVLSLVGATLVWYIWITILPWLSPTSPFRTPFSDLIPGGHNIFISDTPVSWRPATKGHKNLTVDAWKALWSWWKTLIETPSDVHVRLGICSSILRNSSKNGTLHAAVMELTRNELTADHCEWIIQFELPYHLSNRIKELVHSPTSVALAERMNYYLCAIMWMINADIDMDIMKVVEGFSPLLQPGGPLLTLDHFPLKCRALAFGIRVYLLLPNKAKEIQREATNWNMMVDSLDPDSTLTVFGAVTRGLEEGNESLSQDCARMLAVYIGSDGFSNETLTKAQATEGSAKDLRVSKSQKDPTRRIQKFLTQLEQVWKAHMCTRAIQLLQESRSDLKLGGLQALSCLAKNDKFKDAVKNALPNLIHTLKTVDWHTSVACLERLSSLYEHDPFREAINGIYPNIIPLLSNPDERVHDAVFKLLDLVDQEGYINKILNSGELIRDLENDDWHIRVAGLQILTRGIKTNKIQDVRRAVPNVLKCLSFNDPDVRLGAVQAFTELAKEKEFHPIVKKHISDVFRLMLDEFPRVCNTVVVLLSDDSLRDLFRTEIEDNFSTIVTDTLKSDDWSIRRSGLLALCELMKSDEYIGRIKKTLSPDLIKWLKDDDYDVRETALKATSVAAKKVAFTAIVTDALPSIVASFKDRMENVQISALECFSALVAVLAVPEGHGYNTHGDHHGYLAAIKDSDAVPEIISVLDIPWFRSSWSTETNIAALNTLSMLANTSSDIFHDKLKDGIQNIMGKIGNHLEGAEVGKAALETAYAFIVQGILLHSTFKFHITPILSASDTDTILRVLQILLATKEGGDLNKNASEISAAIASLEDDDLCIRVAALRAIEHLKENDPGIELPIADIVKCLNDKAEEVQVKVIETLFKFPDIFRDHFEMLNVSQRISSLLESKSEDIRVTVMNTISKLISIGEFYLAIKDAMLVVNKILMDSTNEDTAAIMIKTVGKLVEKDSLYADNEELSKAVNHIVSLLSDLKADPTLRIAALESFSGISKQANFSGIVTNCLAQLFEIAHQQNEVEKEDTDIFRIGIVKLLSDLAKQEKFRNKINAEVNSDYAFIVNVNWPTRVAFLTLMSNLGAKDVLRRIVNQIEPDIIDILQDDTNEDIRLAGVQFLTIPVVKESFPDKLNQLVPNLVTLLSDSEEDIRVAVLQTLSELAKQDVYQKAIKTALPALSGSLKQGNWITKVAALKAWSALAQDDTFYDIVNNTVPKISACLQDPDEDVRISALDTFSQSILQKGKRVNQNVKRHF